MFLANSWRFVECHIRNELQRFHRKKANPQARSWEPQGAANGELSNATNRSGHCKRFREDLPPRQIRPSCEVEDMTIISLAFSIGSRLQISEDQLLARISGAAVGKDVSHCWAIRTWSNPICFGLPWRDSI